MAEPLSLDAGDMGRRLDVVLGQHLHLSRREVRRLLSRDLVQLNGRTARERDKGRVLASGDRVAVEAFVPPDQQVPQPAPHLPLAVLAEGPTWVMVNKPAGMPVHPLEPEEDSTVLNALAARYPRIIGVGEGGLRSGVVHRLDVETTGCLLFALTQQRWQHLREAFQQRRMRKRYLAIVDGRPQHYGEMIAHLTVAQHHPAKVRAVLPKAHPLRGFRGRRCAMTWREVEHFQGATLVEVDLGTGFLHQIRAMCAEAGHPLLGDVLYGGPTEVPTARGVVPIARPMLHAASLELDEEIRGQCDPPDDFQMLWRCLRDVM